MSLNINSQYNHGDFLTVMEKASVSRLLKHMTYNSRTVYMPASVCQSKMRDLGDECILTEKIMEIIQIIVTIRR